MKNEKLNNSVMVPFNHVPSRSVRLSFRFNHYSNEYDVFLNDSDTSQSVSGDVVSFLFSCRN